MQIATHLVSFNNNRQQTVVVKGLVYTSGTQSLETLCARLIGFLIIDRKFNYLWWIKNWYCSVKPELKSLYVCYWMENEIRGYLFVMNRKCSNDPNLFYNIFKSAMVQIKSLLSKILLNILYILCIELYCCGHIFWLFVTNCKFSTCIIDWI